METSAQQFAIPGGIQGKRQHKEARDANRVNSHYAARNSQPVHQQQAKQHQLHVMPQEPPPSRRQHEQEQHQENNQHRACRSGCQANAPKAPTIESVPRLCNMATTVSYPTNANNCEMIGWHVANMDAKLNALFITMSEIFKDAALLAGESPAAACGGMQELIDPSMFTLLQRESDNWDPSVMNEKVHQLLLIGSWIFNRTQRVVNRGCNTQPNNPYP